MSNIVNTNVGAAVALQYLNATGRALQQTQSRINSGLAISSTKEDSAVYNLAQSLRGDESGLSAVTSSLNTAKSVTDVAINAAEGISDIFTEMRTAALKSRDGTPTDPMRSQYQNDFAKYQTDIQSMVKTASFNGINVLNDGGGSVSALKSLYGGSALDDGSSKTLWAPDSVVVDNQALIGGANKLTAIDSGIKIDTSDNAKAALVALDKDKVTLDKVNAALGAAARAIDRQLVFTSKLTDTIHSGIGNLVDADLAKESASLQALQVKQQLGTQALSIANQAPQSLLSLFRG